MKIRTDNVTANTSLSDKVKLDYINKLIDDTKDIKLFFVVSPSWYGMDESEFKPIKELCERNDIPFIDFSRNKKYVHVSSFFSDGFHLNARGADEFTKDLIVEIEKYY